MNVKETGRSVTYSLKDVIEIISAGIKATRSSPYRLYSWRLNSSDNTLTILEQQEIIEDEPAPEPTPEPVPAPAEPKPKPKQKSKDYKPGDWMKDS